jgi:hypothetical protein
MCGIPVGLLGFPLVDAAGLFRFISNKEGPTIGA